MELKFNKNGDAWVAEFEATDKFNLHMEGLLLGSFSILQRTAGGKYTHVRDIPTYPRFDKVFDYDFNALVYPKFIKIVSETEPTYAEVVSDGEITEIKSQTKEVEVTANGTTQVAPDAGYSYLTGVTVKTNVPQSGGSGGGGSTDDVEYIVTSGDGLDAHWELLSTMAAMSRSIKLVMEQDGVTATLIVSPVQWVQQGRPIASAIKFSKKEVYSMVLGMNGNVPNIQNMTAMEMLSMAFGDSIGETIASLPRITEEEFYTI